MSWVRTTLTSVIPKWSSAFPISGHLPSPAGSRNTRLLWRIPSTRTGPLTGRDRDGDCAIAEFVGERAGERVDVSFAGEIGRTPMIGLRQAGIDGDFEARVLSSLKEMLSRCPDHGSTRRSWSTAV
jgi:hypothetical protein